MKVRVIAAVLAALLAVVGAVLVAGYVQDADARALQGLENKEVYVIDQTVPAETRVADMEKYLRKQSLPLTAVAQDAVSDLKEFEGGVAAVELQPGEQLLGSRLVSLSSLQEPGRVAVPRGLQEVTVQLSPDRVVGGQLKAGDRVGVFASFAQGLDDKPSTEMVFHQVVVTSVQGAPAVADDQSSETDAGAPAVPEGSLLVTLAHDPAASEKMVYAAEFGTIWLAKQSEEVERNDTSASMEDFFK